MMNIRAFEDQVNFRYLASEKKKGKNNDFRNEEFITKW